jgi:hypothetical protein
VSAAIDFSGSTPETWLLFYYGTNIDVLIPRREEERREEPTIGIKNV